MRVALALLVAAVVSTISTASPAHAYSVTFSAGQTTSVAGAGTFATFDSATDTTVATIGGGFQCPAGLPAGACGGATAPNGTAYLVTSFGSATITFTGLMDYFGLVVGTPDNFNTISFYRDGTLLQSFTGNDVSPDGFTNFMAQNPGEFFNSVTLSSGQCCFEVDNLAARATSCQLTVANEFHQYDGPPDVPLAFGHCPAGMSCPSAPPFTGFGFALCKTSKSGCALTATATMLASFNGLLPTPTPSWLDDTLNALNPVAYGQGIISGASFTPPQPDQPDWCEFGPAWARIPEASNYLIQWVGGGAVSNVDSYLEQHVCTNRERVILKLNEFTDGAIISHDHFVFVTGKTSTPQGLIDWNVFDPGWNPDLTTDKGSSGPPSTNLLTLQGHITGFTDSSGVFRHFTVAEARAYTDPPDPMALSVTAESPVELLAVDPLGRRLGNLASGTDVFEIPKGSYVRDFPLADDTGTGPVTGDKTGIKTLYIPSPIEGAYNITATGTGLGTYRLEFRAVASDRTAQYSNFLGVAGSGLISNYQIDYSSQPGSSSAAVLIATFQSTLDDISNGRQLGLIDDQGVANALSSKIAAAANALGAGDSKTAANILNAFINQVRAQSGKHVNGVSSQVLLADGNSLLVQLR